VSYNFVIRHKTHHREKLHLCPQMQRIPFLQRLKAAISIVEHVHSLIYIMSVQVARYVTKWVDIPKVMGVCSGELHGLTTSVESLK
jgi:hypothetical protein